MRSHCRERKSSVGLKGDMCEHGSVGFGRHRGMKVSAGHIGAATEGSCLGPLTLRMRKTAVVRGQKPESGEYLVLSQVIWEIDLVDFGH